MGTILYKINNTTFGMSDVTFFKLEGNNLTIRYTEKIVRCDSSYDSPIYYTDYIHREKYVSGITEAVMDGVRIK